MQNNSRLFPKDVKQKTIYTDDSYVEIPVTVGTAFLPFMEDFIGRIITNRIPPHTGLMKIRNVKMRLGAVFFLKRCPHLSLDSAFSLQLPGFHLKITSPPFLPGSFQLSLCKSVLTHVNSTLLRTVYF